MIEQVLPSEGRLDVTFVHEGTPWWIDVAITAATSENQRTLAARSEKDGRAAMDEEGVKRSRYHGRAYPFVLEAHGRPGPSALSFIRRFAKENADDTPSSAAAAWAALSSVSQAGTAQAELTAYGQGALARGAAQIWVP